MLTEVLMFKQSHRHVYTTENVLRPFWSSQTHTYRRGEAAGSEKSADPLAIDPVRSLAVGTRDPQVLCTNHS